jgi:RNA polymerase sigma factor (sigma-70 family)
MKRACAIPQGEDALLEVIDSVELSKVLTFHQERIARPLPRIRTSSHCGVTRSAFVTEQPMEIQGRISNFEQVMLPHLDAAYNLARWLVRDPSIAEDVVQDAYERAYKYFASFRGGSGRTWLLQIVRNAAYSTLKARRRRMEVSLSSGMLAADEDVVDMDIPDPSPGPEATLAQRQDLATLDDALNALPAAWRECLILRDVETLSYKEIAQIMDVPIGTVMSRLSRARQALQRVVVRDDQQGFVPKNGKWIEPAEEPGLIDARQ